MKNFFLLLCCDISVEGGGKRFFRKDMPALVEENFCSFFCCVFFVRCMLCVFIPSYTASSTAIASINNSFSYPSSFAHPHQHQHFILFFCSLLCGVSPRFPRFFPRSRQCFFLYMHKQNDYTRDVVEMIRVEMKSSLSSSPIIHNWYRISSNLRPTWIPIMNEL